jgi:hypothetical protein
MHISQKTVGLLIEYLAANESQATLGGELKRHNLGDADPGPDDRRFSTMSKARRADKALGAALKGGKEDELVDLATTALRDHEDDPTAPEWVRELLASLRADGFACTATTTVVPSASAWSTNSTTEIRWAITPLGYTGLPVGIARFGSSRPAQHKGLHDRGRPLRPGTQRVPRARLGGIQRPATHDLRVRAARTRDASHRGRGQRRGSSYRCSESERRSTRFRRLPNDPRRCLPSRHLPRLSELCALRAPTTPARSRHH